LLKKTGVFDLSLTRRNNREALENYLSSSKKIKRIKIPLLIKNKSLLFFKNVELHL
jgi:hypothetical protein